MTTIESIRDTTASTLGLTRILALATVVSSMLLSAMSAQAAEPLTGVYARTVSGKVLKNLDGDKNFVPASNLKLISTGIALKKAGKDFRFETVLAYSGHIGEDGCLKGDLYIIGGGDPTLASSTAISKTAHSLFAEWADALTKAGIKRISGSIIADPRCLSDKTPHGSWMTEDIGTYYGASPSGLCFYENCSDFTVSPGTKIGEPANISPKYPLMPWMVYDNACTTGSEGSGDKTWLYCSPLSGYGRFTGSYALGKPAKTVNYSNPFPEFSCAWEFSEYLRRNGIFCSAVTVIADFHPVCRFENGCPRFSFITFEDNAEMTESGRFSPRDSLTAICTSRSAQLGKIIRETNFRSNNLYAETLFRLEPRKSPTNQTGMAAKYGFYRDTEDASDAEMRIFGNMKLSPDGIFIDDGSGLSRKNSVSPKFFCDFLAAMSREKCFDCYLSSIASPTTDSATKALLPELSSLPEASRVHLKSGSMKGVMCYSGYIMPASPDEEIIVFSIMQNNGTESSTKLRKRAEKILIGILQGR